MSIVTENDIDLEAQVMASGARHRPNPDVSAWVLSNGASFLVHGFVYNSMYGKKADKNSK
jgi:hypothetical protein